MSKFIFKKTKIEDLYIIENIPFKDDRGYFMETYNEEEFFKEGLRMKFVQNNESQSVKGVLRGLHLQKNKPQGKLVRCTKGKVFDVAVDLRLNSKTYGEWEGVVLTEDNFLQFYIPEGFAHGFYVMSDSAKFVYSVTNFYSKEDELGVLWNDEDISIKWPINSDEEPILSEKDKKNMRLKEFLKIEI